MNQLPLVLSLCGLLYASSGLAQSCNNPIAATAPDSRYTLNSNGTALDHVTGLTWMRCALGQTWSNGGCTGFRATYPWQQALQQAASSGFAGFQDWRLPNAKELLSLVEGRCYDPAINTTAFPNTPDDWFWSATANANISNSAWIVGFVEGANNWDNSRYDYAVRLVRGGN